MIPTAVLVTRGDVDLTPILHSLPREWPKIVYNNGEGLVIDAENKSVLAFDMPDHKVLGHFTALDYISTDYAYFADDDAICPAQELLDAWNETEHADKVLLNVPDGETPWISWGGICHRDLPGKAIDRYVAAYGMSDDVLLWCDVILAALTPWVNVDLYDKVEHRLDVYRRPNRMVMRPDHYTEQARVKALAEALIETKVAA